MTILRILKYVKGNVYEFNTILLYTLGTENCTVILWRNGLKYKCFNMAPSVSAWTCAVLKCAFGFIGVVS